MPKGKTIHRKFKINEAYKGQNIVPAKKQKPIQEDKKRAKAIKIDIERMINNPQGYNKVKKNPVKNGLNKPKTGIEKRDNPHIQASNPKGYNQYIINPKIDEIKTEQELKNEAKDLYIQLWRKRREVQSLSQRYSFLMRQIIGITDTELKQALISEKNESIHTK